MTAHVFESERYAELLDPGILLTRREHDGDGEDYATVQIDTDESVSILVSDRRGYATFSIGVEEARMLAQMILDVTD